MAPPSQQLEPPINPERFTTWGLRELEGNSVVTAESIKPTDIGTWAIFEVVSQRS
jgi:hypothetical protein